MGDVKRYEMREEADYPWNADMWETDDGDYVLHSDYAALLARYNALVIEHAALLINNNALVEAVVWEREVKEVDAWMNTRP